MDNIEHRDSVDKGQMSVIGADIVVTGNIEASVDLHIEGKVIGDVRCATLILGESSSVSGRIYANRVKVSGTVDGAIETKDLAVEASARVTGEITYERLRVANGGVMEGQVKRRVVEESADEGSRLKLVEAPAPMEAEHAAAE
jgi:cytoskeletal protein CcmA (bactofilin family)